MEAKKFSSYEQQVHLLQARGMDVGEQDAAVETLRTVSYYRLSGYWYPFRQLVNGKRTDVFYRGTTLANVVQLHQFDSNLRAMAFASLTPIELAIRALLGHSLGKINERVHLELDSWSPRARTGAYTDWLAAYQAEVEGSREDFVQHHRVKYDSILPVWAAVEVLDWGSLTRLFGFSPRPVQDDVADRFGLTAPQLESWLKSLNILRNVCAHHGRLFNRVFALAPKLPPVGRYPDLDRCGPFTRTFGQLSMVQYLLTTQNIGRPKVLPSILNAFPEVPGVRLNATGTPDDWKQNPLWS